MCEINSGFVILHLAKEEWFPAEVSNSMLFKITLCSKKHGEASRQLLITTSWSNLLFPACQCWDPCGSSPLLIRSRAREKRLVVEATLSLRGSKLRRATGCNFKFHYVRAWYCGKWSAPHSSSTVGKQSAKPRSRRVVVTAQGKPTQASEPCPLSLLSHRVVCTVSCRELAATVAALLGTRSVCPARFPPYHYPASTGSFKNLPSSFPPTCAYGCFLICGSPGASASIKDRPPPIGDRKKNLVFRPSKLGGMGLQ
jgi:hypothetical protein